MKRTSTLVVALCATAIMAMLAGPAFAGAAEGSWYLAPQVNALWLDDGREADDDVGLTLASLAGAGFIIGAGWLLVEHLRVRRIEERWYAEHPDAHRQRPSS